MKTHHITCLILSLAINLHAQQPAPQPSIPPLPPGPLLKRAPDYSTWTVTFQGHPIEDKGAVKPSTTGEEKPKGKDAREAPTMLSTVVKTGSIILERNAEADGKRHDIWHYSDLRIVPGANNANAMVCPDYGGEDIFSINFATMDFAGLNWLSASSYAGIVKYQDRDCIVLKGSVSPLEEWDRKAAQILIDDERAHGRAAADLVTVPAVAYIDLATRLPVFAQFGQQKRFYQYGTPPQQPLQLPAQLMGPVKEYQQRIARLSAPAARP